MFFKKNKKPENGDEIREVERAESMEAEVSEKKPGSDILAPASGLLEGELRKEFEDFKIKKVLHRIDSTLLKQDVTNQDIKRLCEDAKKFGFYSVCVQPIHVQLARRYLEGSSVKICTVVSFPFGEELTKVKVFQARQAVSKGADEVDMVMCISALKRGDLRYVKKDIEKVVKALRRKPVKVIIETCLLTTAEIEKAAKAVLDAKAGFVKTSTGFFGEGAKESDIRLIRKVVGPDCSIKASGGIKTCHDCLKMLEAGADRIGTSSGPVIAEGLLRGEC